MFRVILVMDIFNRSVVLAKGGNRENYRPVSDSSNVCSNSDPVDIVEFLHPREVYIADLNVLQSKGPLETNTGVIREVSLRADTMLDFGISSLQDVDKALSIAGTAVIGTETGTLSTIKDAASGNPGKISVSIDIKHGKVLKKILSSLILTGLEQPQGLILISSGNSLNAPAIMYFLQEESRIWRTFLFLKNLG